MWMTASSKKTRHFWVLLPWFPGDARQGKNSIDASSISTPDIPMWECTIAAMQLKHVYTQKPLTHDIYGATMLPKQRKVVTQMETRVVRVTGFARQRKWWMPEWLAKWLKQKPGLTGRYGHRVFPTPTGKFDIPTELKWDLWQGPRKSNKVDDTCLSAL